MDDNQANGKSKSFAKIFIGLLILIIVVGIMAVWGYSKSNTPERRAARNLEKTIKVMMTFPDSGADAFYSEANGTASVEEISGEFKIAQEVMDKVRPNFTEKGAEAMLRNWYTYGFFCAGTEWKADIDNVEIKKDTSPNTYTFTADLNCTHPSKAEQTLPITGESQYDEKGLLTYLNVSGKSVYEMVVKNEEFDQ